MKINDILESNNSDGKLSKSEVLQKYPDLRDSEQFDIMTTDMPYYDSLITAGDYLANYFNKEKGLTWDMKTMSPEEYINIVSRATGVSIEELKEHRAKKIAIYSEQMKNGGRKFPTLTLHYMISGRLSQEGLHRSFALIDSGLGKNGVPVIIVHEEP